MIKFDDAARAAAEEISNDCKIPEFKYNIIDVIENHFADLADLNAKMVELAKYVKMRQDMETTPQDKNASYFDKLFAVKCALFSILTDPIVAAAIKGESQ